MTAVDHVTVVELSALDRQTPDVQAIPGEATGAKAVVDEPFAPAEAMESPDTAVQEITVRQIDELAARLASVDGRLNDLVGQLADVQNGVAEHGSALLNVKRSIAAEVEKQTTDALIDAQHNLQLAVNSIAQLALAMAESATDISEDLSADSASALLNSFRVDLDAVLAQLGYVSLETAVGTGFDPHRHRALKRVATHDQVGDRRISRVIRDGYRSASTDRILLFADVEVGRFQP